MSALPKLSARVRDDLIRGCSFFALILVAIVCSHSQACALAATEPVDAAAAGAASGPAQTVRSPKAKSAARARPVSRANGRRGVFEADCE